MNKNKLISTFSSYAQSFDIGNPQVAQKFQHAMNVANYCLDIANFLLLDDKMKTSAFLLGLLHEYGSFEQLEEKNKKNKYKQTMDILFKENKITSYTENKSQISLIKKTLNLFYKKQTDSINITEEDLKKNTQDSKAYILLSILKDSDKLELFGMFKRNTVSPTLLASNKKSFSKTVLTTFRANQKISFEHVESNLDKSLFFVSMFFELTHLISKNLALKIDFQDGVLNSYRPLLSETEINKLERVLTTFKNKFYSSNN